jgi:hypothetical protein
MQINSNDKSILTNTLGAISGTAHFETLHKIQAIFRIPIIVNFFWINRDYTKRIEKDKKNIFECPQIIKKHKGLLDCHACVSISKNLKKSQTIIANEPG